jgi:mRNA-degrading endonuclease toxin of MazEF toxin-antitoxin module
MEEGGEARKSDPLRGRTVVTTPVERGQIYWLSLHLSGVVEDGSLKDRPVLIVSRDELNRGISVLAVPFYSQQLEKRSKFRSCVLFQAGESGLAKQCVAKCDEISIIEKAEIDFRRGPIGRAQPEKMRQIIDAIRYCIRDDTLT